MKSFQAIAAVAVIAGVSFLASSHPVFAEDKAKPEFTVARIVVGTGVENKEPVGATETFPAGTTKVFCFLEATDIAKDTEITMSWFNEGKETLKKNLQLKAGSKWRTYGVKNLNGLKGDWKVEIRDAGGNLVKETKFKVE
jgi:hypothetical protein